MQQQQPVASAATQHRLPKWFFPHVGNTYKYFVLLHDVQEGEISKAHQIYENLKSNYGPSNCHLLQINSKHASQPTLNNLAATAPSTNGADPQFDPWLQYAKYNDLFNSGSSLSSLDSSFGGIVPPLDSGFAAAGIIDPNVVHPLVGEQPAEDLVTAPPKRHGMCLALSDHDRIKTFLSEFVQRGLVPYAERTIKILNEQQQSKKGILKSIGFSRRIFGGSQTSSSASLQRQTTVTMSTSGTGVQSGTTGVSIGATPLATANATSIINNSFITYV